ncbi:MAG: hypothetical protein LBH74_00555 [Nitrososphaerota archaeon]|jgi:hypothetical protein|nr:hypothetical protein [Nitrososphaerota archaeon]
MVHNELEQKVTCILNNPELVAIKTVIEKNHSIDCLLLLYMDKGRWKDAKKFVTENNLILSDATFRSRMCEFEKLGLAKSKRIDPLKKFYSKTELCEKLIKQLIELFEQL